MVRGCSAYSTQPHASAADVAAEAPACPLLSSICPASAAAIACVTDEPPVTEAALIREESLAAMERRFGWGQRSGGTAVKLALGRLAEIYGSG